MCYRAASMTFVAPEPDLAASSNPGGVATTGRLEFTPGAPNVVPSEVAMWSEMRAVDPQWLAARHDDIEQLVAAAAREHHVRCDVEWRSAEHPVQLSAPARGVVTAAIRDLGFEPRVIESGAGHDAAQMSLRTPSAMIFVPSRGGRSHCPEEWTDLAQIGVGVQALTAGLVRLDEVT